MQVARQSAHTRTKALVALLLTFAAGIVDIVGYISVYHIFVAHMTGATVHFGSRIMMSDWAEAARAGATIFSFVAGSVIGRSVIEAASRRRKRTAASMTLLLEAVLIVVVVWIGRRVIDPGDLVVTPLGPVCLLLGLLAAAMGLQTATLTRIGPLTIHTTFVTGMLNKAAQAASEWFFWIHDEWKKRPSLVRLIRNTKDNSALRNSLFMAAIWCSYVIGSAAGTWLDRRQELEPLYLPVAILLIAIAVDQIWPLSVEEEREQA
ncbi:MAG TPA: YoaK family protein [Candidatus Acidoferrum sp.]|nr:YoaK family protein [Candidatus Acidoferrum sp.]